MSIINSVHASAGLAVSSLGSSSSLSPLQLAFQSTLKSLQATSLRSRLVLQQSGLGMVPGINPIKSAASTSQDLASHDLMSRQIARDCGYHPA